MADLNSYKMKLFVFGCVFLAYFVHALVARQKGCSFSVHGQSEKNSPILLHNDTTLIATNNGKVDLKTRQTLTLLCPDPKNYLVGTHSNVSLAQCVQGSILRVANQDRDFDSLQCHKIIKGTVMRTTKKCGNNKGQVYKIGYPTSPRLFVALIEVCYDADVGITLYTEHFVNEDIKYASKTKYRPAFSPQASSISVDVVYKQAFQKSTFTKLLNSAALSSQYINQNSFLSRGHLSPDADFLFAATQYTTYYYVNVVPQWQVINGGNWKKIELLTRKAAETFKETLTVITGTHGVLTLPNSDGKETDIFLVSGKKLPVPKFIWKIVYSKRTGKAIVFVSFNNPFATEVRKEDWLCENVCNKSGWSASSWLDHKRGFVYCCDYKQFTAVVETAPKLQVGGILQGPK